MNSIFNLTLKELEDILVSNGFKKFNATQVFEGIYKKKVNYSDIFTMLRKNKPESFVVLLHLQQLINLH